MSKYRKGSFGFWWTEVCGNDDISDKEYIGDINCSFNQLTSLEGCPSSISGWFDCSANKLTSLKHCPASVSGWFDCSNNQLISLEGRQTGILGWFDC